MIKAVIFDVDGVLLDSFEGNLRFFQDMMTRFGYPPPTRETYRSLFHMTMRATIEALTHASEQEVMKMWEAGRTRDVPYPSHLLQTPDGTAETLVALSKKYVLGIATSRVKECIYDSPQLGKLQHYFSAAAAYQDTERHKPYPDPLLFAAKQLGITPDACVYIGDVENDIIAARAAGMKAVIYAQKQFPNADACTANFRTLPTIVATL